MKRELHMRQVLQNLKDGKITLTEVPCPRVGSGDVLIQSACSLISAGTERMLVEFGRAGLVSKARQQPEKVQQVLDKIRSDGLLPTLETVFSRLDEPMPLGYCNTGTVIEVGADITGFQVGARVVSNGRHAEVVCVPKNLCATIPEGVSNEDAAFTVLAAVGLQGIRLANPTLGETVVVVGLGLVGLVTVQLLLANGCRVLGFDQNVGRVQLARSIHSSGYSAVSARFEAVGGPADAVRTAEGFTQGRGADVVLVTASTPSSEPVRQAAQMCRKRGRIVQVGVTGLEFNRADLYEKELSFQVSCSYGPGRYDPGFEERGQDYPIGYVRWTEQRNFEAVLELMAAGRLDMKPLVSHRFAFEQAPDAYDLVVNRGTPYLGILLNYGKPERDEQEPAAPKVERTIALQHASNIEHNGGPVIGVIGAGNFTKRFILPNLKKTVARLKTIASAGGASGSHLGGKFGFEQTTTDYRTMLADPEIQVVFITTPHNLHAPMAIEALEAGKHVFVEKPLAISEKELADVKGAWEAAQAPSSLLLHVGFNRRFSPHAKKIRRLLEGRAEPLSMVMTVNAGAIPDDHWLQDVKVSGGRIIGEACHFIDLLTFLADEPIIEASARAMGKSGGRCWQDVTTINLYFQDGSIGAVHYFSNGHHGYPKERLELFSEGRILQLHNFRQLSGHGWKGVKAMRLWRQDKGHETEITDFVKRVADTAEPLIPFEQLENVTAAGFRAMESLNAHGKVLPIAQRDDRNAD